MVNTFLTRPLSRDESPEDGFYKSAQLLDNKRLPNQIREALWIYNTLRDLQTVVTTLKWDGPPPILSTTASYQERAERFFERRQWYEDTLTRYFQCDFTVVVKNGAARAVPEGQAMDYVSIPTRPERSKMRHGVKYYWVGRSAEQDEWVPRERLFILDRGERIITLKNYPKHPINFMWHGYEDALGAYLNGHIRATRKRFPLRAANIHPVELPDQYEVPWWCYSKDVVNAFRASLLRKLPSWYSERFSVPKFFQSRGYIWTLGLVKERTVTPKTLATMLARTELAVGSVGRPKLPSSVFASPLP